jgi:hypothetical protein
MLKTPKRAVCLWNGLPAKLYTLKESPPLLKLVKNTAKAKSQALNSMNYWIVEVALDGEPVYLVVGNTLFVSREEMEKHVIPKLAELFGKVLFIVYDGNAHFWTSPIAETVTNAIDQKINPKIFALLK